MWNIGNAIIAGLAMLAIAFFILGFFIGGCVL